MTQASALPDKDNILRRSYICKNADGYITLSKGPRKRDPLTEARRLDTVDLGSHHIVGFKRLLHHCSTTQKWTRHQGTLKTWLEFHQEKHCFHVGPDSTHCSLGDEAGALML